MKATLKRLLPKLAISSVVGLLLIALYVAGGVPILPPKAVLEKITWWTVPVYVLLLAVTHFLRASRWRFLVRPLKEISFREIIALNWVGFFAIFALPMRLGELTRPALGKMRHAIPLSAGLGTVAVERVVDGVLTSLCVAWALFALPRVSTDDPLARSLPFYGYAMLAFFTAAFAALALFLWKRALMRRLVASTLGLLSGRLGQLVAEKVDSVADGLRSISDARLTAGFLLESLLYWASNALGMWLLARGCGLPFEFGHAVGIMGILAIGILLPAGPGLFGSFQLAVSIGLKLYFVQGLVAGEGAAFIFLLYSIQTVFIVATGLISLYGMRLSLRSLLATGESQPT